MDDRLTNDWTGWHFQPGKSATQRFVAIRCTRAEVAALDGLPRENAAFPCDSTLLADAPSVEQTGPTSFTITVQYHPWPEAQSGGGGGYEPARWRIEPVEIMEPTEVDAYNRVIVNTAGIPFDPPPMRRRTVWNLQARIFQPVYDMAALRGLADHVNSGPVLIPRVGPFLGGNANEGELLFRCATLAQEVSAFDVGCWVTYDFYLDWSGLKHLWRLLSLGYTGFYVKSGVATPGRIHDGRNEINFPVRLDFVGKPYVSTYTVAGQAPVANPNPITVADSERLADATYIYYDQYPKADLSQLLPFTQKAS